MNLCQVGFRQIKLAKDVSSTGCDATKLDFYKVRSLCQKKNWIDLMFCDAWEWEFSITVQ